MPYPRFRTQVSKILGLEEAYLWPDRDLSESQLNQASRREIVEVYPNRGAVPHGLWRRLIDEASEQVDVLVFAGLFLVDSHPDLPEQLALRARDGLRARLAYGDPASPVVEQRGIDEGIGMDLGARIRITLAAMAPAVGVEGIDVRLHETVLYNSIYRFDDDARQHAPRGVAGTSKPCHPPASGRARPAVLPLPGVLRARVGVSRPSGRISGGVTR
ncbi:hypothetical protein M8330_21600, partial [Nocardioides sp. BSK12Z-4]|nr:hypothetical protein [Nocardioides bruguierae]